jgi:hypothetical protein
VRFWHIAAWLVIGLGIWCLVDIGPRGRVIPGQLGLHRTDFTVFTAAGAAFFDGRDPYEVTSPRGWHYLYPPLFAILLAPLSQLDTESQVKLWFAFNGAMAFACYFEARRLWRIIGGGRSRLTTWIAVAAGVSTALPVLDCMQAGQLGIAILYFLMLGFRLVVSGRSRGRWFAGGVVLALPAVVKLIPAFPVLFLLAQVWGSVVRSPRGRRPAGRAAFASGGVVAGILLFLLVVPAAFLGWRENLGHLRTWYGRVVSNEQVAAASNFNIRSYRNQSLANAVYLMGHAGQTSGTQVAGTAGRIADPVVPVAMAGVLALLAFAGWAIGARRGRLDQAAAFGLACLATLLLSPISWGHYYMVELPALLCVPLWIERRGMPRLARGTAAVPPVVSWCYYLAQQPVGSWGILALGTAAWFLAATGLILWLHLAGERARRDRAAMGPAHAPLPPRPHIRVARPVARARSFPVASRRQAD